MIILVYSLQYYIILFDSYFGLRPKCRKTTGTWLIPSNVTTLEGPLFRFCPFRVSGLRERGAETCRIMETTCPWKNINRNVGAYNKSHQGPVEYITIFKRQKFMSCRTSNHRQEYGRSLSNNDKDQEERTSITIQWKTPPGVEWSGRETNLFLSRVSVNSFKRDVN